MGSGKKDLKPILKATSDQNLKNLKAHLPKNVISKKKQQ